MGAWDGLLARACALLLLLGMVALALPAASGAAVRRAKLGRHYETISRVCPLPSPGHPECNRLIARSATASTANASYLVRAAYPVGPAGGLTPGDLATAYGVTGVTGTDGAGQTVGIIDFGGDSKLPNDLNSFDSYYGLAPCTTASGCFTIVGNDGTAAGVPPDDADAAAESSMDVETVHALCQLCKIVLVEAPDEGTSLELGTAVDEAINLGADIVSNSYGVTELGPDAEDDDAADYDHPGVAILASSGDDGYDDWDEPGTFDNRTRSPAVRAASPTQPRPCMPTSPRHRRRSLTSPPAGRASATASPMHRRRRAETRVRPRSPLPTTATARSPVTPVPAMTDHRASVRRTGSPASRPTPP